MAGRIQVQVITGHAPFVSRRRRDQDFPALPMGLQTELGKLELCPVAPPHGEELQTILAKL